MPYQIGNYFVYILTNPLKTVLYIGVSNDLARRIEEHNFESLNLGKSFAARYNCVHLVHWERFSSPEEAISREKQLKKWNRAKKEWLISLTNPNWDFLEGDLDL